MSEGLMQEALAEGNLRPVLHMASEGSVSMGADNGDHGSFPFSW